MTWSHDRVFADTTARLDALNLPYDVLPTWFDVDVAEDFQRLWQLPKSELRAGTAADIGVLGKVRHCAAVNGLTASDYICLKNCRLVRLFC